MTGEDSKALTGEKGNLRENIRNVYRDALKSPGASNAGLKFYGRELDFLPSDIRGMSFGCGNPIQYAGLEPGMKVLDVGCGAGVDSLFAARIVGGQGQVAGFDITDEMVESARKNAEKAGAGNVRFETGTAEAIPFEDNWADIAISNAVIHLVPDKLKAFSEIHRVLGSQGRAVISDIVTDRPIPALLAMEYLASEGLFLYGGIVSQDRYMDNIWNSGFQEVEILHTANFDVMDEVQNLAHVSPRGNPEEWKEAMEELAGVRFKVITLEARKTDSSEEVMLPCACGNLSVHQFFEVANVTISRKLRSLMARGALNTYSCPHCGRGLPYPRPFMFHDMERRKMVHVFPRTMESQREPLERAMEEARQKAMENMIFMSLVFGSEELFSKFGETYREEEAQRTSKEAEEASEEAENQDSRPIREENIDERTVAQGSWSALASNIIEKIAKFFRRDRVR